MAVNKTIGRDFGTIGDGIIKRDGQFFKKSKTSMNSLMRYLWWWHIQIRGRCYGSKDRSGRCLTSPWDECLSSADGAELG
jgi:hypothetical protein